MTAAVIVLAHRDPEQVASLLGALAHPDLRLYLHVDSGVPNEPFRRALAATPLEVTALRRRRTRWGGIEIVDAALDGLVRAVDDGCEYFFLISGQDFPLVAADELVAFAHASRERSHTAYWTLPTDRWRLGGRDRTDFYTYTFRGRRETCYPRGVELSFLNWRGRTLNQLLRFRTVVKGARQVPSYVRPYGGSQWWNLNRPAAEHILQFLAEHPDYRAYHEYTLLPDELFFQSILLGTRFGSEHEIVNDNLRFTVWREDQRSPEVLRERDLDAILGSGKLFARKFDREIDARVMAAIAARTQAKR